MCSEALCTHLFLLIVTFVCRFVRFFHVENILMLMLPRRVVVVTSANIPVCKSALSAELSVLVVYAKYGLNLLSSFYVRFNESYC